MKKIAKHCQSENGAQFLQWLPMHNILTNVYHVLLKKAHNKEERTSPVTLCSSRPVILQAGETRFLPGLTRSKLPSSKQNSLSAIIESPTSPLPGGLLVKNCLVCVNNNTTNRVKVPVVNLASKPLTLQPKCTIGTMSQVAQVLPIKSSSKGGEGVRDNELGLDFDGVTLTPEFQVLVLKELEKYSHVFSQDCIHIGKTSTV